MAWAKVGTAAIPLQLSPSVETSSLPRSCPSSSILTMTPGSNGPNTFPLRRRTWYRVTRPARGANLLRRLVEEAQHLEPVLGGAHRGRQRLARDRPRGPRAGRGWGRTPAGRRPAAARAPSARGSAAGWRGRACRPEDAGLGPGHRVVPGERVVCRDGERGGVGVVAAEVDGAELGGAPGVPGLPRAVRTGASGSGSGLRLAARGAARSAAASAPRPSPRRSRCASAGCRHR